MNKDTLKELLDFCDNNFNLKPDKLSNTWRYYKVCDGVQFFIDLDSYKMCFFDPIEFFERHKIADSRLSVDEVLTILHRKNIKIYKKIVFNIDLFMTCLNRES